MAVGVASTGIHQTTNIKFSQLRREFKTISPRSTFDGEDDHSGDSGSVSASDLLRVTDLPTGSNPSADLLDPVVPDVPENENIVTTSVDWKIGGFKNAVKYYYLNQTGRDDNYDETSTAGFNLDDPTKNSEYTSDDPQLWTGYLNKNISKTAFIDGIVGSVDPTQPALKFDSSSSNPYNIKIAIGGTVIGAGGSGGGQVGDIGEDGIGDGGGTAIDISLPSGQHPTTRVNVAAGASVYAGGGGGGKGARGGNGGDDGRYAQDQAQCHPLAQASHNCNPKQTGGGGGGTGGTGGKGGTGAGYIYSQDENWFSLGGEGASPIGMTGRAGAGGVGGDGGTFGDGGDDGGIGQQGGAGTHYSGQNAHSVANCFGNWVQCQSSGTSGQGGQGPGNPAVAGAGGKSISGTGWSWSDGSNDSNVTDEMLKGSSDVTLPS